MPRPKREVKRHMGLRCHLRLEDDSKIRRPHGDRLLRGQFNPLTLVRATVLPAHGNGTSKDGGRRVLGRGHVNATGQNDRCQDQKLGTFHWDSMEIHESLPERERARKG